MKLVDNSREIVLLDSVFLFETINTAASIDKLLFTSEERVARGANLYTKSVFNRTGFKSITACAGYLTNRVFRMNCCFHYLSPLSALSLKRTQSKWHNSRDYNTAICRLQSILSRGDQPFWTCHSSRWNMGIRSNHNIWQLFLEDLQHLFHPQNITLSRRN